MDPREGRGTSRAAICGDNGRIPARRQRSKSSKSAPLVVLVWDVECWHSCRSSDLILTALVNRIVFRHAKRRLGTGCALGVPRRLDGRISAIGHAAPGSRTSKNYCTMERETSVGLTQDHEWSGIRLVLTA